MLQFYDSIKKTIEYKYDMLPLGPFCPPVTLGLCGRLKTTENLIKINRQQQNPTKLKICRYVFSVFVFGFIFANKLVFLYRNTAVQWHIFDVVKRMQETNKSNKSQNIVLNVRLYEWELSIHSTITFKMNKT